MNVSGLFASLPGVTPTKASGSTGETGLTAAAKPSAKDEFLEYAKMTPAQRMRASILDSMGLTEDDLKAMDSKQRQQVEDKIKEMIKAQIQNDPKMQTGSILDVSA